MVSSWIRNPCNKCFPPRHSSITWPVIFPNICVDGVNDDSSSMSLLNQIYSMLHVKTFAFKCSTKNCLVCTNRWWTLCSLETGGFSLIFLADEHFWLFKQQWHAVAVGTCLGWQRCYVLGWYQEVTSATLGEISNVFPLQDGGRSSIISPSLHLLSNSEKDQ